MRIRNGRTNLELHERRSGRGTSLLLLHELHGSAKDWGDEIDIWSGPVFALDFSGHGASEWVSGGAYLPEHLLADADVALAAIRPAALIGKGIGAYVALLLAGTRPDDVPGALLLAGNGLAGGGPSPAFEGPRFARYLNSQPVVRNGADPRLSILEGDIRPPDYVEPFARAARCLLFGSDGAARPEWWEAARRSPCAVDASTNLAEGIVQLAARSGG
jgi:pimeloyl-ACP methyl ester carboxylesterase